MKKQFSGTLILFFILQFTASCGEDAIQGETSAATDSKSKPLSSSVQESTISIVYSGLTFSASGPADMQQGDLMGDILITGTNLAVTIGKPSDFDPPELEKAIADFKDTYDEVSDVKSEVLANGWLFTAINKGSLGENFWVTARLQLKGKALSCSTMVSSIEQQQAAVKFCKSLKAD